MGELNLDGEERRLSTEVKMDPFFCECLSKKIVKMWKLSQPCGVAFSPGCESDPTLDALSALQRICNAS